MLTQWDHFTQALLSLEIAKDAIGKAGLDFETHLEILAILINQQWDRINEKTRVVSAVTS